MQQAASNLRSMPNSAPSWLSPPPTRRKVLRCALGATVAGWSIGPVRAGDGEARAPLQGAGASFPAPLYERWADQYRRETAVDLHYAAVGSVEGLRRIGAGEVDFGASDVPLSKAELQSLGLMQFPVVIGAVVPVLNLRGAKPGAVVLTGDVLAQIYLGRVRRWNDDALQSLNPSLTLPSEYITVVHRADAAGTSQLFSDYLSRHSIAWRNDVGASTQPRWPTGEAGLGNAGLASLVQRTRASIGYVEYAYARAQHLSTAALRNEAGRAVSPGLPAFRVAADTADWAQGLTPALIDVGGEAAWPITAASYVLLRLHGAQAARNRAVLDFFAWSFRLGGAMAEALDYVPLPLVAQQRVEALWHGEWLDASGAPLWPGPAPR
jgi:phosphate transport system substrate-binding protein